jgi:hypothetical protein
VARAVLPVLVLLLLIAGAAVFRELNAVRSHLVSARETLDRAINNPAALRTEEGRAATLVEVDAAVAAVAAARSRATESVVLGPLKALPGFRSQWRGLRTMIDDSSTAASAGRDLLARVDALARETQVAGGRVPIVELTALSGDVRRAGQTIAQLVRPSAGLWGPLGEARRKLDRVARSTSTRLDGGADALDAARSFVGEGRNRRYLVALQNNAEMRDQGMVLSYALARFEGGRVAFEGSGPIRDLTLTDPAPTPVPQPIQDVFGFLAPTRLWQSVNATADFPWTGRAMADMYRHATGQSVDGIIAIDVPGLVGLLRVIGPVQVPGIVPPISAANAPQVLLHDLYQGLPPLSDVSDRREQLTGVTRAVIERLTTGAFDPVALGRELADAARGGHLRLWSAELGEQEIFERTGLGSAPGEAQPDRTFHVAVQNRTATKLDYYVKPVIRQEVQLSPQGTAVVRTTVVVDNRAPVGASPSYQLGPDNFTKNPGDYLAWVLLWGPAGSTQPGGVGESGLLLSQYVVDVAAGQRRELTFDTVIPNAVRDGRFEVRLVPQPRLEPMGLQVRLRAPGWNVEAATAWAGPWNGVRTMSWEVSR